MIFIFCLDLAETSLPEARFFKYYGNVGCLVSNVDNSSLHQFKKYNNFLLECCFSAKKLILYPYFENLTTHITIITHFGTTNKNLRESKQTRFFFLLQCSLVCQNQERNSPTQHVYAGINAL